MLRFVNHATHTLPHARPSICLQPSAASSSSSSSSSHHTIPYRSGPDSTICFDARRGCNGAISHQERDDNEKVPSFPGRPSGAANGSNVY
ncbi:hypothetical protein E2C01_075122 [Portunus trituberculatus]|uniref:Uncharacterized protein n=1 Tax=Portunus trituberculatus TaxID=210409 RepID=A0A5B7I9X2_PORTR|nr:hypothetical protein [Portunus trituberculatus]